MDKIILPIIVFLFAACSMPDFMVQGQLDDFERAIEKREDLVISIDELRSAEKRPSTWFRPQIENSSYKQRNEEIEDSHDVGRHEKPSKEELTERWVNER